MDIVLTPDMENSVRQKVQSGEYESPSAVVTEALRRLLEEKVEAEEIEELRSEIRVGLDQFDRGEYRTYDRASLPLLAEEIKSQGKKLVTEQHEQTAG